MNEVLLLAPVHARTSIQNMGYEYGIYITCIIANTTCIVGTNLDNFLR